MKKWFIIGIAAIAVIVGGILSVRKYKNIEDRWKLSEANVKAYSNLLSNEKKKNAAFELTVDALSYTKDSILQELNSTRKALKVKDKNIKAVQYIASDFIKTDTLILKDTIFKDVSFKIDTVLGDEWGKVTLSMQYPSNIAVRPEFKSVKHVVVSTKKETVNPPKKCWLLRLFQKKHTVLNVDIIEKNPYVINEESRYVEIVK